MSLRRIPLFVAFLSILSFASTFYFLCPATVAHAQTATATPTNSTVLITVTATADTYVQSTAATTNYGTANQLRVRSSGPTNNSYLRFVVTGVSGTVQSAKIRLYVVDASPSAGSIYTTSNNYLNTNTPWVETGMNWNNAPASNGAALSTVGTANLNTWVEFDVTAIVKGNGTFNFAIKNTSTNPIYYNSKEATSNRPALVLQVANSATATATSTPTFTPVPPTNTPTFTPVPPTSTPTATPTTNSSAISVTVIADTYVDSTAATTNYGNANQLRVRSSRPTNNSYLRFVVTSVTGGVQSAKVRLYVVDASPSAGSIYTVSNNYLNSATPWLETGMNWNNAPAISGAALSTVGTANLNTWVEFDVSAAVKGNGTFNFAIRNSSTNPIYYNSKEATSNRPVLVLQVTNSGIATPTSSPTFTPTSTWTNTPLPTSTPTNTATNTPVPTSTATSTFTSTSTPTHTATETVVPPTSTATDTATSTPVPTHTATATLLPPTDTATSTALPPTSTATDTATNTPVPTNTPTDTVLPPGDPPTNTSVPPTSTATDTATNTPAPTNTSTDTAVPPTDTATNTPVPTSTATDTATYTPAPTSTSTETIVPATDTPTSTTVPPTDTVVSPTDTATSTLTPVNTATDTVFPTETATNTPIPTSTSTQTIVSATDTPTSTTVPPTETATDTPTVVNTATEAIVPTGTATSTPVPTNTSTQTIVPATDTPTSTTVPPTETATDTPTVVDTATETIVPTETATSTSVPTNTATDTPVPPLDTATATPTDTSTNTSVPTDTATNTPTATATATPVVLKTPYASAPLCPTHDPTVWHGLWNPVLGCHYDHFHGVDPNSMASYVISGTTITYGPAGALYGGQTIGYSFETPNENAIKHRGYHIQAAIQVPCEQNNFNYINNPKPGCIRSFRIQVHNDTALVEGVTRFHSMFTEAELCTRAGVCGLWQGGGARNDTGEAHIPYKNTCVNIPGSNRPLCPTDPAEWSYIMNIPPYWAFTRLEDALWNLDNEYLCFDGMPYCWNQSSNRSVWELVSSDSPIASRYGEANFLVGMNWRTHAASAAYNSTTGTFEYVCPNSDCVAIGDGVFLYTLIIRVPNFLDSDGNGMIESYNGYTDPAGRVDTENRCSAPSADCVPLRIQNVAVGTYIYDMSAPFLPDVRVWADGVVTDGVRRFDITPADYRCPNNPSKRCSWVTLPQNVQPHVH